jgi:hypothetical protein
MASDCPAVRSPPPRRTSQIGLSRPVTPRASEIEATITINVNIPSSATASLPNGQPFQLFSFTASSAHRPKIQHRQSRKFASGCLKQLAAMPVRFKCPTWNRLISIRYRHTDRRSEANWAESCQPDSQAMPARFAQPRKQLGDTNFIAAGRQMDSRDVHSANADSPRAEI